MTLLKFLTSKTFLKQVLLALVAVVILCFIMLRWLKSSTNHGEFETVPDLTGKSVNVADIELKANKLVMQIQDSANFNPNYPKFSVIEQDPSPGTKVKESRKIYLTLNPSGYRKIQVPNLRERTYRQAKPMLEALGFQIGKITYENNIGKNLVLKMYHKGNVIKNGDKLSKTSKIDLVLGNGKRP